MGLTVLLFILLFFTTVNFLSSFLGVFGGRGRKLASGRGFLSRLIKSFIFITLFFLSNSSPLVAVPFFKRVRG